MRVYKYELPVTDRFTLTMPAGARPLSVGVQAGRPVMWALVEPDAKPVAHYFRLCGTGHEIDPVGLSFVGTYQMDLSLGVFVGHVWQEGESAPRAE